MPGGPESLLVDRARRAWPMPIDIVLDGIPESVRADACAAALRARPGAVLFLSGGRAVLAAACGDLRSFVPARLRGEGHRAGLAPVVDRVLACEAGSGFEADWAQWVIARAVLPEAWRAACARRRVFAVHLDPESSVPACRVGRLDEVSASADSAAVIGPFGTRRAAEAFARLAEERFSLCREPSLLAKRPDAVACAYKDMGKCPAPCDGSEPMESYRSRAREAVAFARSRRDGMLAGVEASMREAAAALDFERAAALNEEIGLLRAAGGRAGAWATTMDRFAVLGVLPSGRRGVARLALHDRGVTRWLGEFTADEAAEALDGLGSALVNGGASWSTDHAEGVGLVCAHLFSGRRTRGSFLRVDGPADPADVERAIRRAGGVEADAPGSVERVETGDAG